MLFHFMRFVESYGALKSLEENALYFYSGTVSEEALEEKSRRCRIVCKVRSLNENVRSGEAMFSREKSAVAVWGIGAFHYQEVERLFLDSDEKIDVDLLKWSVQNLAVGFLFWIIVLCWRYISRYHHGKWWFAVILPVWLFWGKFVLDGAGEFPVWSLPEKWSDMEGWRKLWETVLEQLSIIIQWKNSSALSGYYEGIIQSIYHLSWSFLLVCVLYHLEIKLPLDYDLTS